MKTGISLYFSSGHEENQAIIKKAVACGVEYAFTSLHIPEETGVDYRGDIGRLLKECKKGGLNLIVDVGPETLSKLGVDSIGELKDTGITHVRLDYGFTPEETVELAKSFHVVFNASTITEDDIRGWKAAGADFSRFTACHNFYPKPYTALSMESVKQINLRLKYLGFTTMAFVPGNLTLRGPLFQGLPTVEKHRRQKDDVLLNMLELYFDGCVDVALVGDVDVREPDWKDIGCLSGNYVELKAELHPGYEFLRDVIHHDRPDSSEQVIRSQESRKYRQEIVPEKPAPRIAGSISISNSKYLRYNGEVEIARMDLAEDERVNIAGQVDPGCFKYLPYIQKGLGVKLV